MVKIPDILNLSFGFFCKIEEVRPWDCFHRHNELEFCFFEKGPVIYRFGGRYFEVPPEEPVLFWGAIPHQLVETGDGNVHYWLTIPINLFIGWELPREPVQRILNGEALHDASPAESRNDLWNFGYWERNFRSGDPEMRRILNLMIEARIRQFIHTQEKGRGESLPEIRAPLVRDKNVFHRLYELIVDSYKKQASVEEIAGKLGINPNYATTLFRSKCGIGILEFLTMLRIYEAQRLLITTDKKVIDVALESGFGSVSNFYIAFRKTCGKSPSEYRESIG